MLMHRAVPDTRPPSLALPEAVETQLAEHGIYQTQMRLLLQSPQVLRALEHFDQVRRNVHAHMNGDVMALLGQINAAQQKLAEIIVETLEPYPALQARIRQMQVQLAVIDALTLCALL